jgi:hypothetical protein
MALRRTMLLVFLSLVVAVVVCRPVHAWMPRNTSLTDVHSPCREVSGTTAALSPEILSAAYSAQGANIPELIVPEPGTMLLLGTGLLGLIATVLRHQLR